MATFSQLVNHLKTAGTSCLTPQDQDQLEILASAAQALVDKMAATPWRDRHIGFNEWRALSDALDGKRPDA